MAISDAHPQDEHVKNKLLLAALENEFLHLAEADDPERQTKWPRLAQLYDAVGELSEAALCWANALWESDLPPKRWTWHWAKAEARLDSTDFDPAVLDRLIRDAETRSTDAVRAIVAYAACLSGNEQFAAALRERGSEVVGILEACESELPLKICWLAWTTIGSLLDRPVLDQARDRFASRLAQDGLSARRDLPGFLRSAGAASHRAPATRQWLLRLRDLSQKWIEKDGGHSTARTSTYVDLLFAYGLARAGDSQSASLLVEQARSTLAPLDDAHQVALLAFEHRIDQALKNQALGGSLPPEVLDRLAASERLSVYIVDRLRKHLSVLEPDQRIDPYRHWTKTSGLDRQLAELTDLTGSEAGERIRRTLAAHPSKRTHVLRTALDVARRVGSDFAAEMIDCALDVLGAPSEELQDHAALLERAIAAAAHFERTDRVRQILNRVREMLNATKLDEQRLAMVESLLGQVIGGLRKLGMTNEIEILLRALTDDLLGDSAMDGPIADDSRDTRHRSGSRNSWNDRLPTLLHVASGWFDLRRERRALPIIEMARGYLQSDDLAPRERTKLTCAYVASLAAAPFDLRQQAIDELLERFPTVKDTYTTSSHFSISKLDVVHAIVLAVVGDGTESAASRQIEEEEASIRRRVQMDLALCRIGVQNVTSNLFQLPIQNLDTSVCREHT